MPPVDKHTPGSFSWIELATTDQTAAKQFYGPLFGWTANDFPMGPSGFYTMFQLKGRDTAGCYALGPQMPGVPPHWALYVDVESADDTAARAAELGGKVLKPAFDVFTFGRMAVIQDPTGAVISVWQPKTHIGIGIAGEPGTLCWADLITGDIPRAKEFYEKLFGWEIAPGKDKPADSYLHIKNGGDFIGGIPPRPAQPQHAPPHWLVYFLVADCDASTEQAKQLGAKVYVPPMSIDNNLRLSVLDDPQGAGFALFTGQ